MEFKFYSSLSLQIYVFNMLNSITSNGIRQNGDRDYLFLSRRIAMILEHLISLILLLFCWNNWFGWSFSDHFQNFHCKRENAKIVSMTNVIHAKHCLMTITNMVPMSHLSASVGQKKMNRSKTVHWFEVKQNNQAKPTKSIHIDWFGLVITWTFLLSSQYRTNLLIFSSRILSISIHLHNKLIRNSII